MSAKRTYRAKRADTIHAEIRDALRAAGWRVLDTHDLAKFVDLVAWQPSTEKFRLIEVKTGNAPLTLAQEKLRHEGWPIHFVRSVDEALAL